ncbi:MAG: EfeM/EfeO family lipoprotein [Marmoricola sp.]|nr:EfeM/EfeO family lipoprotein [Marmoricola sp.]
MTIASSAQQGAGTPFSRRLSRRRLVGVLAAVAAAGTAIVISHHDGGPPATPVPHADAAIAGTPVTVGTDVCGSGWTGGRAGPQTFAVWNNSIEGLEVYVQDVATGKVYLDVENLGATVTRSASVTLAPGTYRFSCLPGDADPVVGPVEKVTGSYAGAVTPGLVPITDNDLAPTLVVYQTWIRSRLPVLAAQVRALDADVRAGDLAAAKGAWLRAHLTYETLGAAYDAFGDDDAAINAMPTAGIPAAGDKNLAGFHRIEGLLWSGAPAARIAPVTRALIGAVVHLRKDLAVPHMNTIDIGLRSHEILENALQLELTGASDAGSHTNLATIGANLVGTLEAMKPIRTLLQRSDPDLAETDRWLARSQRLIRSFDHHGRWTSLSRLTRAQHERIDATLSQTVELLSQVAVITDPRRAADQ